MWYPYRGSKNYSTDRDESYRIGFATSLNGENWTRHDDDVGMELSSEGWDSVMQAYPYVIKNNSEFIMFYNGNGFGFSGIGYSILETDNILITFNINCKPMKITIPSSTLLIDLILEEVGL